MKKDKGRKAVKDEPAGGKPGGDETGTFQITTEMIGGNPDGIDAIRILQMIAGGIAVVVLGWFVLHSILHVI